MKTIRAATIAVALLAGSNSWAQNPPTDPQIAHIVDTAHEQDIDGGKYARKHATSKDVKQFAQMMVDDHERMQKEGKALTKKLNIKLDSNDTSDQLKSDGKASMAKLKKLKDAEFDRAYMEHEVNFHQHVLDALDKTLIPNAKNPELKAELEKARPVISGHLDRAKQLQSTLGKPNG